MSNTTVASTASEPRAATPNPRSPKTLRAAFLIGHIGDGWIGGVNYFRNLFAALGELPERTVEPVLLFGQKSDGKHYRDFPWIQTIRTSYLDRLHPAWFLRRMVQKAFGGDAAFNLLLKRHRIGFQSHVFGVASRSAVPTAGWIPDFQHIHLPEFFPDAELKSRDDQMRRIARFCHAIILSSHDARNDLAKFAPESVAKSHVLHFVANVPEAKNVPSAAALAEKYQLRGPYFHLPNQFWAHKNHLVVVRALRILKEQGRTAQVVATGNPKDTRQPDHFQKLMDLARQLGVGDAEFRVLGLVSFPDLVGLMENSVALINPSFFEGWSTTVEEAKSLGKRIILSNLGVHQEQNPPGAVYFDPKSPENLAARMSEVLADSSFDASAMRERARLDFPERRREFGREYCRLARKIVGA